MDKREYLKVLSHFQPGDRVSVQWGARPSGEGKECYQREGVVVQVTPRLIVICSPAGFIFCVSIGDIATGTTVSVKKRTKAVVTA